MQSFPSARTFCSRRCYCRVFALIDIDAALVSAYCSTAMVCLSVCLFHCLPVSLSVCLSLCLLACNLLCVPLIGLSGLHCPHSVCLSLSLFLLLSTLVYSTVPVYVLSHCLSTPLSACLPHCLPVFRSFAGNFHLMLHRFRAKRLFH